jgi:hypothetical protein
VGNNPFGVTHTVAGSWSSRRESGGCGRMAGCPMPRRDPRAGRVKILLLFKSLPSLDELIPLGYSRPVRISLDPKTQPVAESSSIPGGEPPYEKQTVSADLAEDDEVTDTSPSPPNTEPSSCTSQSSHQLGRASHRSHFHERERLSAKRPRTIVRADRSGLSPCRGMSPFSATPGSRNYLSSSSAAFHDVQDPQVAGDDRNNH